MACNRRADGHLPRRMLFPAMSRHLLSHRNLLGPEDLRIRTDMNRSGKAGVRGSERARHIRSGRSEAQRVDAERHVDIPTNAGLFEEPIASRSILPIVSGRLPRCREDQAVVIPTLPRLQSID